MQELLRLFGFIVPLVSLASPTVHAQDSEGRAAVIGYVANVQGFSYYRERYRTTVAEADSLEDALAGRWRNTRTRDTLHIVDGVFERLEHEGPPPVSPKTMSGGKGTSVTSATFISERYLSGESGSVYYTPGLKVASLAEQGDPEGYLQAVTPLTFQMVGWKNRRGPDWMQANPDLFTTAEAGRQVVDGVSLIGMRYTVLV